MTNLLTPHQLTVADRALDAESAKRDHLVIALSGAHAYGFPSPDSDLDLKAIHVADTRELLGLDAQSAAATADFLRVEEGIELDYTSNELGMAVSGLLAGNGNFLERILGPILLRRSPALEELRALAPGVLSRRYHRHYRGFAGSQLKGVVEHDEPPAKRALYVLRTALTGTHLLTSGELVTDVNELLDDYGFSEARELIAKKKAGEKVLLSTADKERWLGHLERALTGLDAAYKTSSLPPEPNNREELNRWLIETRAARLQSSAQGSQPT